MTVEPSNDPTGQSSGYAIVLTLINNIGASATTGGTVNMVGITLWPATTACRQARDAIYDAFPTYPKRTKKRFEASIDRVGPGTLDLEETRRISPATAERILGCTLGEAISAVRAGAPVAPISPAALMDAIADTGDTDDTTGV